MRHSRFKELTRDFASALATAGQGTQAARLFLEANIHATDNEALILKQKASALFLSSGYLQEGLKATHRNANPKPRPPPVFKSFILHSRSSRGAHALLSTTTVEQRSC